MTADIFEYFEWLRSTEFPILFSCKGSSSLGYDFWMDKQPLGEGLNKPFFLPLSLSILPLNSCSV